MSSETATAMMPIVEDPYRIVPMLVTLRNAGATAKNSKATATAPMSAPTSGRPMKLAAAERVATRSSVGVVVAVVMSGHRVPLAANSATASTLDESMNDGPVATFWPPPMVLPLLM